MFFRLLIIFIISNSITVLFGQSKSIGLVDSVRIEMYGKVFVDKSFNRSFADTMILYQNMDTIILINQKYRLQFFIGGKSQSSFKNKISFKKDCIYSRLLDSQGNVFVFVKITKENNISFWRKYRNWLLVISIFIAGIVIVMFGNRTKRESVKKRIEERSDGNDIVNHLESIGYFNYVERNKLANFKLDLIDSINYSNVLTTDFIEDEIEKEDALILPLDYKLFYCDGEELYEEGGIEDYLNLFKVGFEKRQLKLEWSKYIRNKNARVSTIEVNSHKYTVFQGKSKGDEWGIAVYYFAQLINHQLEMQASNERVYLISGGNDGQLIFLTTEQYQYLKSVKLEEEFSPLEINEWVNKMELKN